MAKKPDPDVAKPSEGPEACGPTGPARDLLTFEALDPAVGPLPTRQQRSRDTLARLLDATEEVLAEKGFEGTTIPAIAERAGLSVGVIYRRFPDKEALLRSVWRRFFGRIREKRAEAHQVKTGPVPVPGTAAGALRWLIANLILSYRLNRRILRALLMYTRTHPDPEFRAEAAAINAESLRLTGLLLAPYHDQIRHPDPERAIRYGLLFATMVLREVVLGDETTQRPGYELPGDDLEEELTRLVLGYLGLPLPEDEARETGS